MITPTPAELRDAYNTGRMKLVCQRFGVSSGQASRMCKEANIKTSSKSIFYREDVFDLIDCEHKAYVLGLLVADGYIVEGPGRYYVCLGSADRYIPEVLAALVEYGRPIYEIKRDAAKRLQTEYKIMLASKRLVKRLVELGIRQRKSLKETPVEMCPDLERHFVRGLIDGDGSVGISNRDQAQIHLVGSQAICLYVASMMHERGFSNAKARLGNENGLWSIGYGGNKCVAAIGRFLYGNATWKLPRKAEVFSRIPMLRRGRSSSHKPPCPQQRSLF